MELETVFYVVGIVFMGLMTAMLIALLAAVLVIKARIDTLHSIVGERIDQARFIGAKVATGLMMLRRFIKR